MKRLGALTALAMALLGGWVALDRALGELPPPSLVRDAMLRHSDLPRPLGALLDLLPAASAAPLAPMDLPPWQPPPREARRVTWPVADVAALQRALREALPGDVIELAAGRHVLEHTLAPAQAGREQAPIVLRGAPGARLVSRTVEALKLMQPHWVIEHLVFEGACTPAARCEHALHLAGAAHHVRLQGLELRDFNAAVKVNGEGGHWPDHGLLADSWLVNTAPRPGDAPVTPFDLVGASHWRVRDTRVEGVAKDGGNGVAYGLFMKGGGEGGRFERNLVVCAPDARFHAVGAQVGISFGGGRTGESSMRPGQTGFEHLNGEAVDNWVLNCNDSALDVNQSAGIVLRHNSLLGGGGIAVRGQGAAAELDGNLSSGPWYARPGNSLSGQGNQRASFEGAAAGALERALARGAGARALPGVRPPTSP